RSKSRSAASARSASASSTNSAHCRSPTERSSCATPSSSRTSEKSIARGKSAIRRSSTRQSLLDRRLHQRLHLGVLDRSSRHRRRTRLDRQPEEVGMPFLALAHPLAAGHPSLPVEPEEIGRASCRESALSAKGSE